MLRGSREELRSYCTTRPAASCNLPTTEKQGNSLGRRAKAGVGAYITCSNFVKIHPRVFQESFLAVDVIYMLI